MCGQVIVAVASMTAATCRTKHDKPSNCIADGNGSNVIQAYSQTNRHINELVRLHVKASADHEPIISRHNSTSHPVTSLPPGEWHRDCVMYDDARSVQLVATFCQFFVDKVRRIRDNISTTVKSSGLRTFAIRQHLGPELLSFEPVTTEEVRKLLSSVHHAVQVITARCTAMSTAQVMHSCLCTCHCQTRQPIAADWKVSCPVQESAGATTAEESWAR